MNNPDIANIIMIALTAVYVISTILILISTQKQVSVQQKQLDCMRIEKQEKRFMQQIEVAAIYLPHLRAPGADGKRDLHSTAGEIRDYLIQNEKMKACDYTVEDIFFFCLELHAQEVFYLSPKGDGPPFETWRFSKRAKKSNSISASPAKADSNP